jgi:CBS-domain-containing membrane protein
MFRNVETVGAEAGARSLRDLFARHHVALVVDGDRRLVGILTKIDLVDYLARTPAPGRA